MPGRTRSTASTTVIRTTPPEAVNRRSAVKRYDGLQRIFVFHSVVFYSMLFIPVAVAKHHRDFFISEKSRQKLKKLADSPRSF